MAVCPCGCGDNIGFLKKRTAQHAVDLAVAFPIVERMAQIAPQLPVEVRPTGIGEMQAHGRDLHGRLLDIAHGVRLPTPMIPSPSEINEWRQLANMAAGTVNQADPEWLAQYAAKLSPEHQRLVKSMVDSANARMGIR